MHFHHTALATLVTSFCLETVSCSAVCWQLRGRAPRRGNVIQKLKQMQKLGLVRLKLKRGECSHWCHWERRGTSSSELRLGQCCPRAAAMVWAGVNPPIPTTTQQGCSPTPHRIPDSHRMVASTQQFDRKPARFAHWRATSSAMALRAAGARKATQYLWDTAAYAATYALLCGILLAKLTNSNPLTRNIANNNALKR